MTRTELINWATTHKACDPALEWLYAHASSGEQVWQTCNEGAWMLWALERIPTTPRDLPLKILVQAYDVFERRLIEVHGMPDDILFELGLLLHWAQRSTGFLSRFAQRGCAKWTSRFLTRTPQEERERYPSHVFTVYRELGEFLSAGASKEACVVLSQIEYFLDAQGLNGGRVTADLIRREVSWESLEAQL